MRAPLAARVLACAAFLSLAAIETLARPGGGNSYSGGSSSSSSSSGGSGGSGSSGDASWIFDLLEWIRVQLGIGPIPFYGVCFGVVIVARKGQERMQKVSVDIGGHPATTAPRTHERDDILELVRKGDPDFSLVLFEDFAYALYAESQRARHDARALSGLAPYWSEHERGSLGSREPHTGSVQAVVVGSLRPERAFESGTKLCVEYFFETNLHIRLDQPVAAPKGVVSSFLVSAGLATVTAEGKRAMTQYVQESWTFSRDLEVKTRPWTGVRKLGCPSCGAPLSPGGDVRCPSCGEESGEGRFDWQVTGVFVRNVEAKEHSLTGSSVEVGTDAPTQFASFLTQRLEALFLEDPALSAKSIESRLRLIFTTLQSAWSAQDLRPLRPFVSDRQYDYLQYWIEAYQEQGLRNLMESPRLENFVFARVERDARYDALTLRVWATGCDYTLDTKSGRVVGGSRSVERRYSEYWTLIRSATARGAPRLDHNCPGCGVSLTLNMAGECEQCGAHVTSGEFDWVLSKIEQDESYRA